MTGVFLDGEASIMGALRTLESAGYLHRVRRRIPDGRLVTRTFVHDTPRFGLPAEGAHAESEAARARGIDDGPYVRVDAPRRGGGV
ncbi:hypothetical protein G3I76_12815, partial [Streptomyces sp. SID11233]|nr:hypothetical protein [Streptomyces sp. SID11233]